MNAKTTKVNINLGWGENTKPNKEGRTCKDIHEMEALAAKRMARLQPSN